MEFSITSSLAPPTAYVVVQGELDIFTSRRLSVGLHEAIEACCRHVVVDLSLVTFIDASALNVLVTAHRMLSADHGSLRFTTPCERFERLCRMTGLDQLFAVA